VIAEELSSSVITLGHTARTPPSVIRTVTAGCWRKPRNGFLVG
jgi:hypothetical protein